MGNLAIPASRDLVTERSLWRGTMLHPKPIRWVVAVLAGLLIAGDGSVQAQGQPSLQQAQSDCRTLAQQQTGYNPDTSATSTQAQGGGRARGAAAGAMAGAAKGRVKANQYENVPDEVADQYTKN